MMQYIVFILFLCCTVCSLNFSIPSTILGLSIYSSFRVGKIGTYTLLMDTGSADALVYSIRCGCGGNYAPHFSSSATVLGCGFQPECSCYNSQCAVTNNYISLSGVVSLVWNDTLNIGGTGNAQLNTSTSAVGEIVQVPSQGRFARDGIMGLGFAETSAYRSDTPLVSFFAANPAVYPSIYFQINSQLSVNVGFDPAVLPGVEVTPVMFRGSWIIVSQSVIVNNAIISIEDTFIADTGTTGLYFNDALYQKLQAAILPLCKIAACRNMFNTSLGLVINATDFAAMPSFSIVFNARQLVLGPSLYLLPIAANTYQSMIKVFPAGLTTPKRNILGIVFLRIYDAIFDFSSPSAIGFTYGGSPSVLYAPRTFSFYRNNYQNLVLNKSAVVEVITSSDTTEFNVTAFDLDSFYTVLQVVTITNTTTVNSVGVSTTITNTTTVAAYNSASTTTFTTTTNSPYNPITFSFIELVDVAKQRYCNLPYGFVTEDMCVDFVLYIVSAMPLRGIPVLVVFGLFFCTFFPLTWFFCDQLVQAKSNHMFIEVARRFSLNKKMLYYTIPQLILFAGSALVCAGTFGFVVVAIDNQMRPLFTNAIQSFTAVNVKNITLVYGNYSSLTVSSLDILRVGTQSTLDYLNSFYSNVDLASIIIEWVFNAVIGVFVCVLTVVGTLFIFKYEKLFGVVLGSSILLFLLCLVAFGTTEIVRQISMDYCSEVRYRYGYFSAQQESFQIRVNDYYYASVNAINEISDIGCSAVNALRNNSCCASFNSTVCDSTTFAEFGNMDVFDNVSQTFYTVYKCATNCSDLVLKAATQNLTLLLNDYTSMQSYQVGIDTSTQLFIGAKSANAAYNAVCSNDLWAILTLVGLAVLMFGINLNTWFLVLFRRPRDAPIEAQPAKSFVDPRDEFERAEEQRMRAIADEAKAALTPSVSEDEYELRTLQRSSVPEWKAKLDQRRRTKQLLQLQSQPQLVVNTEPANDPPSNGNGDHDDLHDDHDIGNEGGKNEGKNEGEA